MGMIDFTGCPVNRFRAYGGANGNKINVEYHGNSDMLKLPPIFDFISSLKNAHCTQALESVSSRIDMARIQAIIEATPGITPLQREFYQVMISERKEKILDYSMELLAAQKQKNDPQLSL